MLSNLGGATIAAFKMVNATRSVKLKWPFLMSFFYDIAKLVSKIQDVL